MMKKLFLLGLVALVLLSGCRQSTTVILPPDTTPSTVPSPAPTVPSTTPITEPTTEPPETTEAPTEPTVTETEPTTLPPTEAPTQAPPRPTSPPVTQPPTQPPTEAPTEPDVYDIGSHTISGIAWELLAELNSLRSEEGLPALTMDHSLCGLAAIRAHEIRFSPSHSRPDGRDWSTVLADYGIGGTPLGENLLYGSNTYTAKGIADLWMRSETHRDLILHSEAVRVGIAVGYADGQLYYAVLFVG